MDGRDSAPTPIVGLVVGGASLLLAHGLLEVWFLHSAAVYGLGLSPSISVVPASTIVLAVLIILLAWWYGRSPSWVSGALFIGLGSTSYVLGGGFLVGGILIIVGGALACFADWVEETIRFRVQLVTPPVVSDDGGASIQWTVGAHWT